MKEYFVLGVSLMENLRCLHETSLTERRHERKYTLKLCVNDVLYDFHGCLDCSVSRLLFGET